MSVDVAEPLFSARRLAAAFQIAFLGACALAGVRVITPSAPLYADIAFRVVCVVGAVGNAWWLYRSRVEPGKPWLTQRQTDLFSLWIEAASVIVAVGVLALLAVLVGLWLVTL